MMRFSAETRECQMMQRVWPCFRVFRGGFSGNLASG